MTNIGKIAIQFDLPKVSTTKTDMNCSFTEKMRRVEYLELDEAKLLQDQVNSYKQTPWKYDKEVSWFTSEIIICCSNRRRYQAKRVYFLIFDSIYFRLQILKQAIHGRLIVCDVTSIYANDCINNSRKQLDSLTLILESLKKLKSSDSFLFIGYPLLSQVNVGVFYVLVNMFHRSDQIC
ncbi:uncharacterized protein LOC112694438 [Sipha flava]|uniref:Uncharacterized protein LOC112694438 n=1 Tax=Sipha flava TaxID=143950 RepID=A0A8B8GSS0_9HEMI|nr:uncharacterized protein LOC112694438 [Sipha flava]